MSAYDAFLKAKVRLAPAMGFGLDAGAINPALKPHQAAMVKWLVEGGRRACFAAFGLGKSVIQLETVRLVLTQAPGRGVIVCPLGVRQEFIRDAMQVLGWSEPPKFIRSIEEARSQGIYLTNYETVRDGKLDPREFVVASLDEASILRGFGGSKTFREFMRLFTGDAGPMGDRRGAEHVRYRFVATATPSPNEYIELLAYADFLGIMDVSQAKTRFFKRDSVHADKLTLHGHKEEEFWMWVASWALFVQRPSDLGFSDAGYDLPPLDVRWHEVATDHHGAGVDRGGQHKMFRDSAVGVQDAAAEKRNSLQLRVQKVIELLSDSRRAEGEEAAVLCQLVPEEQRVFTSQAERAREAQLLGESPEVQGAEQALDSDEPGTDEDAAESVSREKCPANRAISQGVLPETQGEVRPSSARIATAEALQSNAEGVQGIAGRSREAVRHLQSGKRAANKAGELQGGSLPRDRKGARLALHELQLGAGDAGRQSSLTAEGGRVSDQIVIWCDLNDEQKALEKALAAQQITCSSLTGSDDLEWREELLHEWRVRRTCAFLSKPTMYGAGINLQQSHTMIFVGIGFRFCEVIQAVHRIHRFLQTSPCTVHFIYTEAEREVRKQLERKWRQHDQMVNKMTDIIRQYGLSKAALAQALTRKMGVERVEVTGPGYRLVNNDCVQEAQRLETGRVGLILTSIPFSTQYEYSPNYADFGHSESNEEFFAQLDFLTPELLRALSPGRLAAIHVKDRIVPGGMTGLGFQTVYPFHCRTIEHFVKHGFAYMGMKTIVTDVVRENNQTYRLGWSEQCKDGSRMGVGMPEYLLIFRKPPSDASDGYADKPVGKLKPFSVDAAGNMVPFDRHLKMVKGTGYSRSRWQIDAHGFTRSAGDRLLCPEELMALGHDQIFQLFRQHSLEKVYAFEHHVRIGETLEETGRLPVTFMLLQPQSWSDEVWTDITRMLTLNGAQSAKGKEMHLCLARDSRVLTRERGYVPIQEVVAGESVLTHKGRWRPVLAVKNTGVQPVVKVKAQGVPGLWVTPDHKLWTRKSDWARQREGAEQTQPAWVEAQHALGGYLNLKLPDTIDAVGDETLWWLAGRWLADGHIDARGSAIISCGPDKWTEFTRRIGRFGGNTPHHGTALQLQIHDPDRELRDLLELCGRGAANKRIPPAAFTLPATEARALLDGYLSGDGYFVSERNGWILTSVSRDLLLGIAFLVQRVYGAIASIHAGRGPREHIIEGRAVQARQEWTLSFDLPGGRKKPFILDDGAWKRVRSIDDAGEVETWCLKVEEDESFTAEGCIVKNCPMQFDLADRAITQWSMAGETVLDPFGGLMTVPLRALKLGRVGVGFELNPSYFVDGASYCRAAAEELSTPSLFDLEPKPELQVA